MRYVFNLIYVALAAVFLPLLAWKAARQGKYRQGWPQKLWGRVPRREGDRPCIWLHAVSLGEVNLLAPLLAQIQRSRPDLECVISTTTQTGFAQAQRKYPEHLVFYCPLDFSWAVDAAMRRIHPDMLVLAELELWPNLVAAARRHGAKVAVVNGRLSEKSRRRYRLARPVIARLLRQIDLIAAQTEEYAEGFRELGAAPGSVQVVGSMKFDGAQTDRGNPATGRLAQLAHIGESDLVFLAGSTQEPEEEMAVEVFRSLQSAWPDLRLLIAPRHPERFESVAATLDRSGLPWRRRTRLEGQNADPAARILLIDTVGELAAWWGLARIAFVGGSMGRRGGQNMIEPAAFGAAVSFGPNTKNFRDIVALLLARDAAVVVQDQAGLEAFVRRCLEDPRWREELGRRGQRLAQSQLGAAERTWRLLESSLAPPAGKAQAA